MKTNVTECVSAPGSDAAWHVSTCVCVRLLWFFPLHSIIRGDVSWWQPRGGPPGVSLRRWASRSFCSAQSPPTDALHCTRHVSWCNPWQRVSYPGGSLEVSWQWAWSRAVVRWLIAGCVVYSSAQPSTLCPALLSWPWRAALLAPPVDTMSWCHIRLLYIYLLTIIWQHFAEHNRTQSLIMGRICKNVPNCSLMFFQLRLTEPWLFHSLSLVLWGVFLWTQTAFRI